MPAMKPSVLPTLMIAALLLLPSIPAAAQDTSDQQEIVNKAETTIQNFAADPDMTWFRNNIEDARAVLIVPTLVKAGFVFGGSGGSGVLLARDQQTDSWTYPAFYTMGSVTFGLQIGGEVAEVVLLVMSDEGLDSFLSGSFKLGGDVSIAAGPVGAGAKAQTADVIAFSRSKGVYGGLTLEGAVVEPRSAWNADYYGQEARPVAILINQTVSNPQADPLRNALASIGAGG